METCLDIGSQALDCNGSGKNTFCKIGRQQTAKTVEVDAMLREAPDALEHVRGAWDGVASQLGARTAAAYGTGKNKRKRESCAGLKRVLSKRCGDGTCHADASKGVQLIADPESRLCVGCGTEGPNRQSKQPIEGYEFRGQALKKRGGGR